MQPTVYTVTWAVSISKPFSFTIVLTLNRFGGGAAAGSVPNSPPSPSLKQLFQFENTTRIMLNISVAICVEIPDLYKVLQFI